METLEEYKEAIRIGYSLFQGYFFSKPIMESGVDIGSLNTDLLYIIQELRKEEPNYDSITEIIAKDLGLSYKLLKMSNSIYYGSVYPDQISETGARASRHRPDPAMGLSDALTGR